ncbi:hypothetical protein ACGTRS_31715 [Burkholderia semiarida]|uniref:Uncharacterized protein n=1 Tax=Burkholderia semiarida TaxID=2843303 RepID=A0ABW7LCS8_9BURK
MYDNDIGAVVRAALCEAGCDASLIGDLDPRATVEISLKDAPTIFVGYRNEDETDVMIWAAVCDYHDSLIESCGARFLEEVMKGVSFGTSHQLIIREVSGELQISAQLREDVLRSSEEMANAIQEFFDVLVTFVDVTKR